MQVVPDKPIRLGGGHLGAFESFPPLPARHLRRPVHSSLPPSEVRRILKALEDAHRVVAPIVERERPRGLSAEVQAMRF